MSKTILVTGGSRGIGRACGEALARQGATVVVNYVRGEAAAREVADGIVARGGKARTKRGATRLLTAAGFHDVEWHDLYALVIRAVSAAR